LLVPLGGVDWLSRLPADARRGRPDNAHGPLLRGEPPLHREDGFELLLFSERRPFHPDRFHANIDVLLDGVVRTRGRFWLASRPDTALWLESAGAGSRSGTPDRGWRRRRLGRHRRGPPGHGALGWDPYYGDRGNEIVVLTDGADHAEITAALRDALVTTPNSRPDCPPGTATATRSCSPTVRTNCDEKRASTRTTTPWCSRTPPPGPRS